MSREQQRDLFQIQARLFREFQLKFKLSAKECAEVFAMYNLYDYIRDCYEEYHVQGDEANLADLEDLLFKKGWMQ